jgi:hypothetical protein
MSTQIITPPREPVTTITQSDRQALADFANGTGNLTTNQLTAIMRVAARYLLAVVDEMIFVRTVKGRK